MRYITLLMAIGSVLAAHSQGEYRRIENVGGNRQRVTVDDVYEPQNRSVQRLGDYDNVQYVTDGVVKTLVIHQQEEQVYHTSDVVVHDYGWVTPRRASYTRSYPRYGGRYTGYYHRTYRPTQPRSSIGNSGNGTQIVNYGNNVSFNVTPTINRGDYEPVNATDVAVMEWHIQFSIGSSVINEYSFPTFGEIKEFALKHPTYIYYIDGYADANTGTKDGNYVLATNRVNAVVQFLMNEGSNFTRNKLFTCSHRDVNQIYGNNNMNRCVTIKAVNGHNQ